MESQSYKRMGWVFRVKPIRNPVLTPTQDLEKALEPTDLQENMEEKEMTGWQHLIESSLNFDTST